MPRHPRTETLFSSSSSSSISVSKMSSTMATKNLAFFVLLISVLEISFVSAKKSTVHFAARKEDVPYIKCQVCEKIADQIYSKVVKKDAKTRKVSEYEIIEIAENVCNLKKEEADWMLQIDIVEKGDKLELVDQGAEGHCNTECKTIERACQEIMGYSDTDVAEYVYKHRPSLDKLVAYLCKDLSKACSVKPPPVPKDRKPGESFVPKPDKDAEMDKIMRSMEGMPGAPGMKMYSRDELMNNKFGLEDPDDDDDDDEDNFPGKLGSILREKKESPKKDIKERILQGATDAGTAVKGHINRVAKQIKSWWRGTTTSGKPSKKSKTGKAEL